MDCCRPIGPSVDGGRGAGVDKLRSVSVGVGCWWVGGPVWRCSPRWWSSTLILRELRQLQHADTPIELPAAYAHLLGFPHGVQDL